MKSLLSFVVIAVVLATAACCGYYSTRVNLDGYSDKLLVYTIYRYDVTRGGKIVTGNIQWKAVMNPNPDKDECNASTVSFSLARACGMSITNGSAANIEEAKRIILEHFEQFKANNALMKRPKTAS